VSAWTEGDVTEAINGIFQVQAKLGDRLVELAAIRSLLEEDDERGDEEEG
jgi:hypothetical protein